MPCHPEWFVSGKLSGPRTLLPCHSEPAGEESRRWCWSPPVLLPPPTSRCHLSTPLEMRRERGWWNGNSVQRKRDLSTGSVQRLRGVVGKQIRRWRTRFFACGLRMTRRGPAARARKCSQRGPSHLATMCDARSGYVTSGVHPRHVGRDGVSVGDSPIASENEAGWLSGFPEDPRGVLSPAALPEHQYCYRCCVGNVKHLALTTRSASGPAHRPAPAACAARPACRHPPGIPGWRWRYPAAPRSPPAC